MLRTKISIILLNWNGFNDTLECIKSLYNLTYSNFNIIIVDNNSQDGSVARLKDYLENINNKNQSKIKFHIYEKVIINSDQKINFNPKELFILKNNKNSGFGPGNNIGIKFALKKLKPDYILILNNDTVVDEEFLTPLNNFMETNKDIGICSPIEYSYSNRDTILTAGININRYGSGKMNFSGLKSKLIDPFKVTYANGAGIFIRSDLITDLKCFDKEMFIGCEDMDLSLRCWIRGYPVFVVPESKIYHKHNLSIRKKPKSWLIYFGVRSILRCYLKTFQLRTLIFILPSFFIFQLLAIIGDIIIRRDVKIVLARFKAISWNILNLIDTLSERKIVQKQRALSDNKFLF